MKIVVIGGTWLIGSKTIVRLRGAGHDALAAAPDTGVNTITGDGRPVHADPQARYFGGRVEQFSLVPTGEAQLGRIHLADWVRRKRAA
jgi:hypothetical protein